MTAEQAIAKIKSVKTNFMGHIVNKNNYAIEIREKLQKMSERNEITPSEYWRALKLTWPTGMSADSEIAAEWSELNK